VSGGGAGPRLQDCVPTPGSGCFGAGLGEGESLVAEVGDDLQPAAEGFDVGGQGPQFGRAGLGVLDGGDAALGNAYALGYLGLGDAEAAAHLGEPSGALLGAELFHACGDGGLVFGVGEELAEKFLAGVVMEFAAHRLPSSFRLGPGLEQHADCLADQDRGSPVAMPQVRAQQLGSAPARMRAPGGQKGAGRA